MIERVKSYLFLKQNVECKNVDNNAHWSCRDEKHKISLWLTWPLGELFVQKTFSNIATNHMGGRKSTESSGKWSKQFVTGLTCHLKKCPLGPLD